MTAIKNDVEKIRMELLSVPALRAVAEVLTDGARKYSDNNWREGFNWSRLYGAALRHLTAHMSGEDQDPETGLSHLAHLGCCVMFLLEHEIRGLGTDDRYKTAVKSPEVPDPRPEQPPEEVPTYATPSTYHKQNPWYWTGISPTKAPLNRPYTIHTVWNTARSVSSVPILNDQLHNSGPVEP